MKRKRVRGHRQIPQLLAALSSNVAEKKVA